MTLRMYRSFNAKASADKRYRVLCMVNEMIMLGNGVVNDGSKGKNWISA